MSHPEQLAFVSLTSRLFPEFFREQKVLEIGSLDVNGSVRKAFTNCDYIGIDISQGPGVDVVAGGQEYDAPDASFGIVISCECLEHNPYWQETLRNAARLLRPGGMCLITCAAPGRAEHGTAHADPEYSPFTVAANWDYYGNLDEKDVAKVSEFWEEFEQVGTWKNFRSFDFYLVGIKRDNGHSDISHRWSEFIRAVDDWVARQNSGFKPWLSRQILRYCGENTVSRIRSLKSWIN